MILCFRRWFADSIDPRTPLWFRLLYFLQIQVMKDTSFARDLYIAIKPTPGSWYSFWFFTENGKVLAKLCKHFSNVRKLFQFFQDPDKKLVLALYSTKFYLKKKVKIGRTIIGDLNKNAALATFKKKSEKKSHFPASFWKSRSK